MAFSRIERWARRLDDVEKDINKYYRWATGEVVILSPDTMDRVRYAVTKLNLQSDLYQG